MKMPLLPALRHCLVLLTPMLVLSASLGSAATPTPPQLMAYQSFLTDQNGNPLGSTNVGPKNYNVVFRIWDLQSGGATNGSDELYAEQQTVTVNNGFFSVLLGQGSQYSTEPHTNAISGLFAGGNGGARYLEMTVLGIGAGGANITILPRAQLLSSPYAFLAGNAVNATTASSLVNNNNSTQVVTVTNGDVGIGIAAPTLPLSVSGNAYFSGNVGIGTTSPGFPLNFANILGDKISLYGNVAGGSSYGFGIQSSLLQIHSDSTNSDIAFGSGSSASLTEVMRIKGNGNVGIGNPSPQQPLDVKGLMQVNTNGTVESPGTKNTFNGMIETSYGNPMDRYGLGQFNNGVTALYTSGAFSPSSIQLGLLGTNAFSPYLTVTHNGPVGIGTTSPDNTLTVSGSWSSTYGDGLDLIGNSYGGCMLDLLQENVAGWGIGMLPNSGTLSFMTGKYGAFAGTTQMVLSQSGYLGIGTTSPNYPIDVENYNSYTLPASGFGYYNQAGGTGRSVSSYVCNVSIYAGARIICNGEIDTISDARVKEIVGRSDTRDDLATVRKLKITDYRKIDRVQFGGRLEKGVIAQEVETAAPEAVSTSTNFIPNIYALPKTFACTNQTLVITMAEAHGLVVGDVVRLMTGTGEVKAAVTAVESPLTFAVKQPAVVPQQLFVFGKQVGDFRTVNYDRLFTTGLGAIQELAKRADDQNARVTALEQEVTDLKKLVGQLAEAAKNSKLTAEADRNADKTVATASLDR